jgi:hypothetical protein
MNDSRRLKYVIGILFACAFSMWLCVATHSIDVPLLCHETDITDISEFPGTLLLFQDGSAEGRIIYELTTGQSEPRELYRLPSAGVSDARMYPWIVSLNGRHVVFSDDYLVDITTGSYRLLPRLQGAEGLRRGSGSFSPDGAYFAYALSDRPAGVFVFNLATGETTQIYTAPCGEFTNYGKICGTVDNPKWIDTSHLLFSHVGGMPTFTESSYLPPDTLTIMAVDGITVHSYHTPVRVVGVTGSTVMVSDGGYPRWLDTAELLRSEFALHEASVQGGWDHLLSPDGQYVLSTEDRWKLTELRTGTTRRLGARREIEQEDSYCVWSPDGASVACQGYEPEKFGGCKFSAIVIAPLSEAREHIVFRSEQPVWQTWGNLLAWLP